MRDAEAITEARNVARQAVRMLQAVRDSEPVDGLEWDDSEWDRLLLAPLEEAVQGWEAER